MITLTLPLVKSLSFKIAKSASIKKSYVLEQFSKSYGFQNYRSFQVSAQQLQITTSFYDLFEAIYKASNLNIVKINKIMYSEKQITDDMLKEDLERQEQENQYYAHLAQEEQELIAQEMQHEYEQKIQEEYGHLIAKAIEKQEEEEAYYEHLAEQQEEQSSWQTRMLTNNILNDHEQLARDYNRYCSRLEQGMTKNDALYDFKKVTAEIILSLDYKLVNFRPKDISEDPPFTAYDIKLLLSQISTNQ